MRTGPFSWRLQEELGVTWRRQTDPITGPGVLTDPFGLQFQEANDPMEPEGGRLRPFSEDQVGVVNWAFVQLAGETTKERS